MFLGQIYNQRKHELITIRSNAMIQDAARLLVTHGIGALLVMDDNGDLAGIFSERDLTRCIHRHGAEGPGKGVSEFMTPNPICCTFDDDINAVMTLMKDRHIRHLPVMQDGRAAAMVSIRDVIGRLLEVASGERDLMREYINSGMS